MLGKLTKLAVKRTTPIEHEIVFFLKLIGNANEKLYIDEPAAPNIKQKLPITRICERWL